MAFPWEDALLSVLLVGYAIWWAYDLRRGTEVNRPILALHLAVYVLLFLWVFVVGTVFVATIAATDHSNLLLVFPLWALFVAVFYYSTRAGYRLGLAHFVMERSSSGEIRYRGLAAFPVVWLMLWFARLGLEGTLLGGYSVFIPGSAAPGAVPWVTFLAVGVVIEVLYFVSFGLMMGITFAVWSRFRRVKRGAAFPGPSRTA